MKKQILFLVVGILLIGFVLAQSGNVSLAVNPVCGNGLCESGEGIPCTDYCIVGQPCPMTNCPSSCPQDCSTPTVNTTQNGTDSTTNTTSSGSNTTQKCRAGCICSEEKISCGSETEASPIIGQVTRSGKSENISIKKTSSGVSITQDGIEATSSDLSIANSKLYLQVENISYEVKILPKEAFTKIKIKQVKESKLERQNEKAVYIISGTNDAKILGFISASIKMSQTIDAETGEVISTQKSWWSFLASED